MEYSINQLSKLSGISTRTLRYYDEIALLIPSRNNEAGYRFYGEDEVNLLQQILFYKERGLSLENIRSILYDKNFDMMTALCEHLSELEKQQKRLTKLIDTVRDTISSMKGEITMCNSEKFEVFKKDIVDKYENLYGAEARKKYGNVDVDMAMSKVLSLSQEDYERFQHLGREVKEALKKAVLLRIQPESETGRSIATLHKEWLGYSWNEYTVQKHKGMINLYMQDERFKKYYDVEQDGCAEFLLKAVSFWAEKI
ncbi:MAG: MerR family transcriptional regulator [Clostridiales bacterium]|nr:MerR family transcriptional regulator [Clostridiales bacterium]